MSGNSNTIKEIRASLYRLSWELSGKYPLKIYKEMINKEIARLCYEKSAVPEIKVFNPGDLVCTFDNLSVNDHTSISQWTRKGVAPRNPYVNNAIIHVLISNLDESKTMILANKLLTILKEDDIIEFITDYDIHSWVEYLSHISDGNISSDVKSEVSRIYRSIMESIYAYKDAQKKSISDDISNLEDCDPSNPADINLSGSKDSTLPNPAGSVIPGSEDSTPSNLAEDMKIDETNKDYTEHTKVYKKIPNRIWLMSGAGVIIAITIICFYSVSMLKSSNTSGNVLKNTNARVADVTKSDVSIDTQSSDSPTYENHINTTSNTADTKKGGGTPKSNTGVNLEPSNSPAAYGSNINTTSNTTDIQKNNSNTDIDFNNLISGNTAGNINNDASVVQKDEWIYYSLEHDNPEKRGIYKVNSNNSNPMIICKSVTAECMNIVGDYIYFINDGFNLCKMKTDGSEIKLLDYSVNGETPSIHKLHVVGNSIYYIVAFMDKQQETLKRQIRKMSSDGRDHTILAESKIFHFKSKYDENSYNECKEISNLAVSEGWVYYDIAGEGLYRMDTYGKNNFLLVSCNKDEKLTDIVVDSKNIYYRVYSQYFNKAVIYKANRDGSNPVKLMIEGNCLNVVDNSIIYSNKGIYSVKTDGSQVKQLSSDNPRSLIVMNGWIYFKLMNDNQYAYYKMKLDGTERQKVIP